MELRWLGAEDVEEVLNAAHLFDEPSTQEWTERFFASSHHHLCIAYVDDEPAGFVSGVDMSHPDKGTEMFLYELGVDDAFRGRGIATALIAALAERARDHGCYGMWVLTDEDNAAAMAAYQRAGGTNAGLQTMLEWKF